MDYAIDEPKAHPGTLPPEIFRHWIHSREEDAGKLEVYRPEGFAFPPSFGRDGFEMLADGRFIQEDIGPADGVVRIPGRWQALGKRKVSVSFDPATGREGFVFEIVALDKDVLQIRRKAGRNQSTGHATQPAMDDAHLRAYQALPPATSFRLLDFEHAEILTLRSFPPQFVLRVSGTKPIFNMQVELVPLVFVQQPEYWGIEVVGSLRGIGLPALAPYTVSIPLAGIIGTRGVEVIGATRSQRFDIFPDETPQS